MDVIADVVARAHGLEKSAILTNRRGGAARSISLYLCRKYAGLSLNKIADYFGLNHYDSVSEQINQFEKQLQDDRDLEEKVNGIFKISNEKI